MKIHIKTPDHLKVFESDIETIGIGRGTDNELVIDDPRASRHHCKLSKTPEGYRLEDLGSRNGVYVGKEKATLAKLSRGEYFRIGKTVFYIEEIPKKSKPSLAASEPAEAKPAKKTQAPAKKSKSLTTQEAYLEGIKGPHQGQKIPITKLPYTVGRKGDNDFRLEDQRASGYHMRILMHGDVFYVEDLKSRNGTVLNGKKLTGEKPLQAGARLQIGDSQFRVQVPGGPAPEPTYEDPNAEYQLSRFNPDEFMRTSNSGQPLVALGLVVVMGALLYFAVDISLKMIHKQNIDPSPAENILIENWSFEKKDQESDEIIAWQVDAEQGGHIEISTSDGVRFPGERALKFRANSADEESPLSFVAYKDRIRVVEGNSYTLSGYVSNRTALGAGLMARWLRPDGTELGRTYTPGIIQPGDEGRLSRKVTAPKAASNVEICAFVLGGEAIFDRLYFSSEPFKEELDDFVDIEPIDPELDTEAEETEETKLGPIPEFEKPLVLLAQAQTAGNTLPVRALLNRDGVLREVRRGPRAELLRLWPGLPQSMDPIEIGPRLSTTPVPTQGEGVYRLSSQLPNFQDRTWHPIEIQIQVNGGQMTCQHFYRKIPGEDLPSQAGIYFELSSRDPQWKAFNSEGLVQIDKESKSPAKVSELVIGEGEEQVVCLFVPEVELSALKPEGAFVNWRLFASVNPDKCPRNSLQVSLSRSSGSEDSAVKTLIARAQKLKIQGNFAQALEVLKAVKENYPWRKQELRQVNSLIKEWSREGKTALAALNADFTILKETGSSLVYRNLLARGAEYVQQLKGTPHEASVRNKIQEIEKYWTDSKTERESKDLLLTFKTAEEHYVKGEFSLAEFFFEEVRGKIQDPDIARKIEQRLDLLDKKREGRAKFGDG